MESLSGEGKPQVLSKLTLAMLFLPYPIPLPQPRAHRRAVIQVHMPEIT